MNTEALTEFTTEALAAVADPEKAAPMAAYMKTDQLFYGVQKACVAGLHESEFFICKAIGWALREYAKTNPDEVRALAVDNRDDMSRLSFREATKHLDV